MKHHLCSAVAEEGPGQSEGLGTGLGGGNAGAGGWARMRVGGSGVRGMIISTVGFLIIGIICSPSFSPTN